jgi:hypothetical protein
VYLTGFDGSQQLVLPGLGYGQVSQYMPLAPGDYTFSMRPAGAPTSTPAVVTSWAHIDADALYTFEAVGQLASISSTVIDDRFETPPAGQASVRVIQAAATSPDVDVHVVQGPVLADRAVFPSATTYAAVPAGALQVQLSAAGSGPGTPEALTLDAGTVNSLVVLDGTPDHPLRLVKVVDATGTLGQANGAPALPVGGVQTGGGGTASRPAGPGLGLPALIAGLAASTVAFALATRRRRDAI